MARPKRPLRARTIERQERAASDKVARTRNKLLDLAPGGSESHPIDVPTPALVEPKATAVRCPRCDEPFTVEEHEAHAGEHGRLRRAKLLCKLCGTRRSMWFRIVAPS